MPRAVWRNRSGLETAIHPGEACGMSGKALRSAAIEIALEKLSHSGEAGMLWGRFAALETLTPFCRSRLRGRRGSKKRGRASAARPEITRGLQIGVGGMDGGRGGRARALRRS